jgi:hypothetical protein
MYPIIYVRGYAMTESERDETTSDPFCGFNIGSTVFRASADRNSKAEKYVFESPLIRLVTEYGYQHVYQNGSDILDPNWEPPRDSEGKRTEGIPAKSIIILRYYDDDSSLLGDGTAQTIDIYARKLNDLVLKVRSLVQASGTLKEEKFKCYMVAHSMGGLIVRTFLQNRNFDETARASVDKFFTFATPHNGIEVAGLNVPGFLHTAQMNTFNRKNMANYLNMDAIYQAYGRVDFIPESAIASDRVFCLVGTNRNDYEVLHGGVRAFVGHGSDGLVQIENASLWGIDDQLKVTQPVATAYTFRSHSGYFGIVNSEEAYQNLSRFLFGDERIDIWVDIENVVLPREIVGKANIEAVYQFELSAAPKGKRWFLTRRKSVEDSPACRTHAELDNDKKPEGRSIYLSSVFLSKRAKVDPSDPYLSYGMRLSVKVPDYIIDKKFWPDTHYEGANLFNRELVFKIAPPHGDVPQWTALCTWKDGNGNEQTLDFNVEGPKNTYLIPFDSASAPGIKGNIRLIASAWD